MVANDFRRNLLGKGPGNPAPRIRGNDPGSSHTSASHAFLIVGDGDADHAHDGDPSSSHQANGALKPTFPIFVFVDAPTTGDNLPPAFRGAPP